MIRRTFLLLAVITIAGCGGLPAGASDVAREAGLIEASLAAVGNASVGAVIHDPEVTLVAVRPAASGGYEAAEIASSSPVAFGQNSVRLAFGPMDPSANNAGCCGYAYGTAAPGVARVTLDGYKKTAGGTVANGVWAIAIEGVTDINPSNLHWTFQARDGSPIQQGVGLLFPGEASSQPQQAIRPDFR